MNAIQNNLFEVNNINKTFRNNSCIQYQGRMSVQRNCFTFITGDSGVGKSTLLHILGLLDTAEPTDSSSFLSYYQHAETGADPIDYFRLGKGNFFSHRAASVKAGIRRADFGFLPQDGHLLNNFTVRENLQCIARFRHHPCQKESAGNSITAEEEIKKILQEVGFKETEENIWKQGYRCSPLRLSGGQRQRLALARSVICADCQPKVIFVDEPTTFMNEELVELTVDLLVQRVREKNCSILLVTHDHKKMDEYLQWNFSTFSITEDILGTLRKNGLPVQLAEQIAQCQPSVPLPKNDFWSMLVKQVGDENEMLRYRKLILTQTKTLNTDDYTRYLDTYYLKCASVVKQRHNVSIIRTTDGEAEL